MRVTKKPDRTKKMSTPMKPPRNQPSPAWNSDDKIDGHRPQPVEMWPVLQLTGTLYPLRGR